MTLLATVLRDDFVLSIADRCGAVFTAGKYEVVDTHLNKHVFFGVNGAKGAVTYTGCAKWPRANGRMVTTDKLISDAIVRAAAGKLGDVFKEVAIALESESAWLIKRYASKPPLFTVHFVGKADAFREPWLALITDSGEVPDWSGRRQGYVSTVGRFKIHFGIVGDPYVLWGGDTSHLTSAMRSQMERIITAKSPRPFDVANYVASLMQKMSKVAPNIGSRSSAIVAPANGYLDTGIWVNAGEETLGVLPEMVFPNGTQWTSSEMKLGLSSFVPGRLDSHNIMYRAVIRGRIPRRMRRKLDRFKSDAKTPTLMEMISFGFFGVHWDGKEAGIEAPSDD